MTGKQRAALRALGNQLEPILQIGKNGVEHNLEVQVDEALKVRELVKISVLETAPVTAREAAVMLAAQLQADVIQVIGNRLILYRQAEKPENRKIKLP
jgi:RNA-binding protein